MDVCSETLTQVVFDGRLQQTAHLKHLMFPLSAHTNRNFQWMSAVKRSLEAFDASFKCSYK